MRLPEAKIKEAITHPDRLVRQEALDYFAACYSLDSEVMPAAIKALETYGRRQAFVYVHGLVHLVQTEATVNWVINELQREGDLSEDYHTYFPALSRLLCNADPKLLAPRAEEIMQVPGFQRIQLPEFQDRLAVASWDGDQCWKEMERISELRLKDEYSDDVAFDRTDRVIEALARQGEQYTDRILGLLGKEIEDFDNDPMTWMEIYLVTLAGEMRLKAAIPLIVHRLHQMGEILSEACVEALGKIGTDEAAEAITEGWLETEWDYRLYATSALEKIHSDTTVRKCLELLPQDKDSDIRIKLADALLGQVADEAIEPVRQMVEKRAYEDGGELMGRLVAVSTILGVTFPEYAIWKRASEDNLEKKERRMGAMWRMPPAPPAARKQVEVTALDSPAPKMTPFMRNKKQVGRNDPCPCGSGKKFKKCCISRSEA